MQHYHVQATGIGSLAAAYYLGYTLMQLPAGFFLDRFRTQKILLASISLCVLSASLFLLSHQLAIGLIMRFVMGLGSAFAFIAVLSIAKRHFPDTWFTTVCGITIGLGTLSGAMGETVTACLIKHWDWQFTLLAFTVTGLAMVLALLFVRQEPAPPSTNSSYRWHDIKPALCHRRLWLNGLVGGLCYLPTSIFAGVWGINFMVNQYHMSKVSASALITLLFVGWVVGSPIMGFLVDKFSHEKPILMIMASLAAACAGVFVWLPAVAQTHLSWFIFCFGFFSSAQVIIWRIYNHHIHVTQAGFGIALTNMIVIAVASVGQMFVGILMDIHHHGFSMHYDLSHYHLALSLLPGAFILAAILTGLSHDR